MMGVHVEQKNLFSYGVDLDKRVRSDNPLRKIVEVIDFSFVREEVRDLYGHNGNESVGSSPLQRTEKGTLRYCYNRSFFVR